VVQPRGGPADDGLRGGSIVNVGSRRASSARGAAAYAVSKAALHALTAVLAEELRKRRCRGQRGRARDHRHPRQPCLDERRRLARAVARERVAEAILSFCTASHFVDREVVLVV